jgi:hypothetical protein
MVCQAKISSQTNEDHPGVIVTRYIKVVWAVPVVADMTRLGLRPPKTDASRALTTEMHRPHGLRVRTVAA